MPLLLGFVLFFVVSVIAFEVCYGFGQRKCKNPSCKELKNASKFDLQLQTEECLKSSVKDIDALPWMGGVETDTFHYECLRAELRKLAPPNGRAVLLILAKCGCPVAKVEG